MILSFTLITFALFVLYVEGAALRDKYKALKRLIHTTFGRADFVYPNTKQPQSWMRSNTIQRYK